MLYNKQSQHYKYDTLLLFSCFTVVHKMFNVDYELHNKL